MIVAATAASVAVIDWLSKVVAASTLDEMTVDVGPLLRLRLTHNSGVSFGLGDQLPPAAILAVTGLPTVALAVAALRGLFAPPAAAGAALGGAVANLGDRAIGGSVVDFLDTGWWPSFNLADVFLTVGCVAVVGSSFRAPRPSDT